MTESHMNAENFKTVMNSDVPVQTILHELLTTAMEEVKHHGAFVYSNDYNNVSHVVLDRVIDELKQRGFNAHYEIDDTYSKFGITNDYNKVTIKFSWTEEKF